MSAFPRRLMVLIPLDRAGVCAGCEGVFYIEGEDTSCPCSETHFLPLETIIGTIKKETPERLTAPAIGKE